MIDTIAVALWVGGGMAFGLMILTILLGSYVVDINARPTARRLAVVTVGFSALTSVLVVAGLVRIAFY